MTDPRLVRIYYERNDQGIRFFPFQYQGEQNRSCPQYFPILIHQPAQFAAKLPVIEKITPAEDHA